MFFYYIFIGSLASGTEDQSGAAFDTLADVISTYGFVR